MTRKTLSNKQRGASRVGRASLAIVGWCQLRRMAAPTLPLEIATVAVFVFLARSAGAGIVSADARSCFDGHCALRFALALSGCGSLSGFCGSGGIGLAGQGGVGGLEVSARGLIVGTRGVLLRHSA